MYLDMGTYMYQKPSNAWESAAAKLYKARPWGQFNYTAMTQLCIPKVFISSPAADLSVSNDYWHLIKILQIILGQLQHLFEKCFDFSLF